jgi:hypothetical protein
MNILYAEFDCFEFEDLKGNFRLIRGCPLSQRQELASRLNQVHERLQQSNEGETLAEAYDRDKYLGHLFQKCLELCGVSLDWLDINMMSQFLLPFEENGEMREGLLVQINFPKGKRKSDSKTSVAYEELLAALWSHTQDLQKALELAESIPAEQLMDILEARSSQIKNSDPQEREKAMKRDWQAKCREDIERLQQATIEGGN